MSLGYLKYIIVMTGKCHLKEEADTTQRSKNSPLPILPHFLHLTIILNKDNHLNFVSTYGVGRSASPESHKPCCGSAASWENLMREIKNTMHWKLLSYNITCLLFFCALPERGMWGKEITQNQMAVNHCKQ